MNWIYRLLIVLVSGTVFNVWLLRFSQATPYRGADAANLQAEFLAYGLNETVFYLIGGVKLLAVWRCCWGLSLSKQYACSYHHSCAYVGGHCYAFKVADPLMKSVPAIVMLTMSLGILGLQSKA